MKRNYIIYGFVAVLFLIAVYFVTVAQVLVENQNEFNENVYKEAREQKKFDKFIGVQVEKYLLLDEANYDSYKLSLYQLGNDQKDQKIVLIIVPTKEIIHADNYEDLNDLSKVTAVGLSNNTNYLNTDTFDVAISFGYDSSKIGFMFFEFDLNKDDEIKINYFDYSGKPVFEYINNFNVKTKIEAVDFTGKVSNISESYEYVFK